MPVPIGLYPSVHAKNKRVHAGQLSSLLALFGLANGRVISKPPKPGRPKHS